MIVETTAKLASGDLPLAVAYIGLGLVWYPIKQVLRRMSVRRANETPDDSKKRIAVKL